MKRLATMGLAVMLSSCGGGDADPPKPGGPSGQAPQAPLLQKKEAADWCGEHGVPESVCTRCNVGLVEGFKKKGDWCVRHDLPDSQCLKCHPELEAKFKAMATPSPFR